VLSISDTGKLEWSEAKDGQAPTIHTPEEWYHPDTVILKDGEIGIERREMNGHTAYLMKVGDGNSVYAELPYTQAVAADVYEWAKSVNLIDGVLAAYTLDDSKTGKLTTSDTLRDALNKIENAISAHTHEGYLPVNQEDTAPAGSTRYNCEGHFYATKVFGSTGNDYAEYRACDHIIIPGAVVVQDEDKDAVRLCNRRRAAGAMVVSDTFGFAIGKTSDRDVPVAVSGRVLAYTDELPSTFRVGDMVCAGKNGTVSRMRRWEAILFPDRILGIVSYIPEEETWHGVWINDRIWIKLR